MEKGTKRKRDEGCPRITYNAGARTFDRLLKEDSLEEVKAVVRKKLGYTPDVPLQLAQSRDGRTVDLEDEDDFEAFCAAARSLPVIVVQVTAPTDAPTAARAETTAEPITRPATPTGEVPKKRRKKSKKDRGQTAPVEDDEPAHSKKRKLATEDPVEEKTPEQDVRPPKKKRKQQKQAMEASVAAPAPQARSASSNPAAVDVPLPVPKKLPTNGVKAKAPVTEELRVDAASKAKKTVPSKSGPPVEETPEHASEDVQAPAEKVKKRKKNKKRSNDDAEKEIGDVQVEEVVEEAVPDKKRKKKKSKEAEPKRDATPTEGHESSDETVLPNAQVSLVKEKNDISVTTKKRKGAAADPKTPHPKGKVPQQEAVDETEPSEDRRKEKGKKSQATKPISTIAISAKNRTAVDEAVAAVLGKKASAQSNGAPKVTAEAASKPASVAATSKSASVEAASKSETRKYRKPTFAWPRHGNCPFCDKNPIHARSRCVFYTRCRNGNTSDLERRLAVLKKEQAKSHDEGREALIHDVEEIIKDTKAKKVAPSDAGTPGELAALEEPEQASSKESSPDMPLLNNSNESPAAAGAAPAKSTAGKQANPDVSITSQAQRRAREAAEHASALSEAASTATSISVAITANKPAQPTTTTTTSTKNKESVATLKRSASKVAISRTQKSVEDEASESSEGEESERTTSKLHNASTAISRLAPNDAELTAIMRGPTSGIRIADLLNSSDIEDDDKDDDDEGLLEVEEEKDDDDMEEKKKKKMFAASQQDSSDEEQSELSDEESREPSVAHPPAISASIAAKVPLPCSDTEEEYEEDDDQEDAVLLSPAKPPILKLANWDQPGDRSFHDVNALASSMEIGKEGDRAVSEALAEDTAVFRLTGDGEVEPESDGSGDEGDESKAATEEPEDEVDGLKPEVEESVSEDEDSPEPQEGGDPNQAEDDKEGSQLVEENGEEQEEKELTPQPPRTPTPEPALNGRAKGRTRAKPAPVTPPRRVLRSRKDPIEQFTPQPHATQSPIVEPTFGNESVVQSTPRLADAPRTRLGKTPQLAGRKPLSSRTEKMATMLETMATQNKQAERRGPATRGRSKASQVPAESSFSRLLTPPPAGENPPSLTQSKKKGKEVVQRRSTRSTAALVEEKAASEPEQEDDATPVPEGDTTAMVEDHDITQDQSQNPLFIESESQTQQTFPYSQWTGDKPRFDESDESEEEEVARAIRQPRPSSQRQAPAFRRLTEMVVSPDAFRTANLSGASMRSEKGNATERELFGQTGSDSDSSDEDSDSSEEDEKKAKDKDASSHIPKSRRASARFA